MSGSPEIHTPYDGSSKPFTIGLAQLDEAQWLEEDENLIPYLDEKLSLYKTLPDKDLVEDEGRGEKRNRLIDIGHRWTLTTKSFRRWNQRV